MLDEIDSGLDVDSLKVVGKSVVEYFKEYKPAILLITHYDRLLDIIKPTHVHIISDGKIVKTGSHELVKYIEENGFNEEVNSKFDSTGVCAIRENLNNE